MPSFTKAALEFWSHKSFGVLTGFSSLGQNCQAGGMRGLMVASRAAKGSKRHHSSTMEKVGNYGELFLHGGRGVVFFFFKCVFIRIFHNAMLY